MLKSLTEGSQCSEEPGWREGGRLHARKLTCNAESTGPLGSGFDNPQVNLGISFVLPSPATNRHVTNPMCFVQAGSFLATSIHVSPITVIRKADLVDRQRGAETRRQTDREMDRQNR